MGRRFRPQAQRSWQAQHVVYLVDPVSIDQYTYPTATIGGGIAVRELIDRILWMRRFKGNAVYPIVQLTTRPMSIQRGTATRPRPHFEIVSWTKFDTDEVNAIPANDTRQLPPQQPAEQLDAFAADKTNKAEKMKAVLHTIGGAERRAAEPQGRNRRRNPVVNPKNQTGGAPMPLPLSLARARAMPIGVYDLETRSTVNLTLCGAWNYAAHPSTSILCMYLAVDDGEPERWLPGDPIPSAFLAAAEHPDDWQLIAHNHEFERAIYELILMPRFGFPPIPLTVQHCTQQLASRNAYPAELGLLSQALGLPYRKDREAAKAMRELSRPRKPRRGEDRNQSLLDRGRSQAPTAVRALPPRRHHDPGGVDASETAASERHRAPLPGARRHYQSARYSARSQLRRSRPDLGDPGTQRDQSAAGAIDRRQHHQRRPGQALRRADQ